MLLSSLMSVVIVLTSSALVRENVADATRRELVTTEEKLKEKTERSGEENEQQAAGLAEVRKPSDSRQQAAAARIQAQYRANKERDQYRLQHGKVWFGKPPEIDCGVRHGDPAITHPAAWNVKTATVSYDGYVGHDEPCEKLTGPAESCSGKIGRYEEVHRKHEECPEKTTYQSLDDGEGTVYASSSSYFGWNKYKQSRAYVCKPKFWAGLVGWWSGHRCKRDEEKKCSIVLSEELVKKGTCKYVDMSD